ncbi:TerD family protein [Streptomyces sp. NBC_00503]|uniref:TerD family protein n=1 Tax=Streptomyces sp. NBC_00503 TaxID=2903659 RepID=UPI002E8158EA|nr:TerD family protein [Streptomyces sp. NBC_00503]WUD84988.1 TerD family protein [Streptomyces sp. NBC_00503]
MSGVRKGLSKVEIALRWDPSPAGAPVHDLDILAAVYGAGDPYGQPVHLVHFGSRSPDGTITLDRDSRTGQGLGFDEVMTLELSRMATELTRVVVGVVIQPASSGPALTFSSVAGTGLRIREGYTDLAVEGFAAVGSARAATVAEFTRETSGSWALDPAVRGFDADPEEFARVMGSARS